jgi:predicted GNAT family acetyltransferase
MSEIAISKEDDGRHGRYVARVEGREGEAELTFTHRGQSLISADHTGAPDSLKGTGVASALVEHLIAEARAQGFRIIPLCPFVRARYEKHPEWRDVMTVEPGAIPHIR